MLYKLLDLMRQGESYSISDLAKFLQVSEGTVKAQVEYLEHIGKLRRIVNCRACRGNCKTCKSTIRKQSHALNFPEMWELLP